MCNLINTYIHTYIHVAPDALGRNYMSLFLKLIEFSHNKLMSKVQPMVTNVKRQINNRYWERKGLTDSCRYLLLYLVLLLHLLLT